MHFWKNVSKLLRERDMSIRSLATQVGVTPGAISKYSRGTSPNLAVAQRIAEVLDVSLDYLVSAPGGKPAGGPFCKEPAAHDIIQELGLEELLLLYRLGSGSVAWEIASALAASYPNPMGFTRLRKQLRGVDPDTLKGHLVTLRRKEVITETEDPDTGESYYQLTRAGAILNPKAPGDASWHAYKAVRHILQAVLPAVERQDDSGYMFTMTASVPPDSSRELAEDLKTFVRQRCQALPAQAGSEDLTIVFCVAYNPVPG